MIICINQENVDNKTPRVVRVVLQADTTVEAESVALTGEGITDLADAAQLYPGSLLVCLQDSSRRILGGDNTWHVYTA